MELIPNVVLRLRYYKPEDANRDASNPKNKTRIRNRNYYSSNSGESDYMKYVEDGVKSGNGFDYMEYMTSHKDSSGVFSKKGFMTDEEKKEVRKLLRNTKSVIWDMVISFSKDFGKEKVKSDEDAIEIVKSNFPKILKENGLEEENVVWFAGLHRNTDNKHIHISFFELEPTFKRANKKGDFYHNGKFTPISLENFKVEVESYMSNNKYFFESYRRNLMSGTEETLNNLQDRDRIQRNIRRKLAELYHRMPSGRVRYGHKSMENLRPLIGEIETLILRQKPYLGNYYKELKDKLNERDLKIKSICGSQNIKPERFLLTNKYLSDFHRRIGNKIIDYAKKYEVESKFEGLSYERQKIIRNRMKKQSTLLFKQTAILNRMVSSEAEQIFEEYQNKLREAEYQRLVEEGIIEAE